VAACVGLLVLSIGQGVFVIVGGAGGLGAEELLVFPRHDGSIGSLVTGLAGGSVWGGWAKGAVEFGADEGDKVELGLGVFGGESGGLEGDWLTRGENGCLSKELGLVKEPEDCSLVWLDLKSCLSSVVGFSSNIEGLESVGLKDVVSLPWLISFSR